MQSKSTSVTPALPPTPVPHAPTDPYVAGLWQQWRAQLRLTMKTPWLATKWLEESRKLLVRAGRIYHHLCRQPRPIRRRLQRQLGASLAGVALALALANAPAQAADFTANDAASLIAAINNANNETTNHGPDTITLTGDVTLTASYFSTYSGDTGLPLVSSEITIEGAGHTIMRDAGAPAFRLLAVDSSGDLTLNAVTLRGGNTFQGGAIHSQGTLVVNNSTLLGHHSGYAGGAIYNSRGTLALNESILSNNTSSRGGGFVNRHGTVTVSNSTISDNTAPNSGGGFRNRGGTVTVSNSTLSGNYAEEGGAVSNGDMLIISNSTFSGNSANIGAAIYNDEGTLTLNNSTLSGNSASASGGAIYNYGTVTLNHSLISGNSAGSGAEIYNYDGSTVNANNFNLIGYSGDARSSGFTPGANDIVPSEALAAILDTTLADNGGPSTGSGTATLTHALVPGSPAIDAAGDSGFDADQRGIARPQGAADDIGAFELEVVAAPEIDISGNGVSIAGGDNEPDPADHTDFGSADIDGGTVVRTFTISNTGDAELSGITVSVDSGLRAAAQTIETLPFSVTSAPATTVAPGESTEFQITFDPSEVGASTAVVIIESNDADEGLYNFAIGGIGSERLLPNTHLAAAGAATQSCETGSAGYVYDCTVTFNLSNTSSSVLAIGHYRVNSISAHAHVLNGDPTPGQAGTIIQAGEFVNSGSNFQPEFVVGLTTATRYAFRFSVFGVTNVPLTSAGVGAGATGDELVELGTFDITFEPGADEQSYQLYLPTVVNR